MNKMANSQKQKRRYWRKKERDYYSGCRCCHYFKTTIVDYKVVCLKGKYSPATKEIALAIGEYYICAKSKYYHPASGTNVEGTNPDIIIEDDIALEAKERLARLFKKD